MYNVLQIYRISYLNILPDIYYMFKTVHTVSVYNTVHKVQNTVHKVHNTVHTVIVHNTVHTVHNTLHEDHCLTIS